MELSILSATDEDRVEYINRILDDILNLDLRVSDDVRLGAMRIVVDPGVTVLPYSLFSEKIGDDLRTLILQRLHACFSSIFEYRCESVRICDVAANSASKWNSLCFMWWRVLPRHGIPYNERLASADRLILDILGEVILLDNLACKESALRGLGLWHIAYPGEVEKLIEDRSDSIPDALRKYAAQASAGDMQ
jgi:hypothetical protein